MVLDGIIIKNKVGTKPNHFKDPLLNRVIADEDNDTIIVITENGSGPKKGFVLQRENFTTIIRAITKCSIRHGDTTRTFNLCGTVNQAMQSGAEIKNAILPLAEKLDMKIPTLA